MKTIYRSPTGFVLEEECTNLKDVFQFVGRCKGLFEHFDCCGHCGGTSLRPQFHSVKGMEFYSFFCPDCNYEFKLGSLKDMADPTGLFIDEKSQSWQLAYGKQEGGGPKEATKPPAPSRPASAPDTPGQKALKEAAPF